MGFYDVIMRQYQSFTQSDFSYVTNLATVRTTTLAAPESKNQSSQLNFQHINHTISKYMYITNQVSKELESDKKKKESSRIIIPSKIELQKTQRGLSKYNISKHLSKYNISKHTKQSPAPHIRSPHVM